MKNFFKSVWYYLVSLIVFVIVGFLGAYFITEFAFNNNLSCYRVTGVSSSPESYFTVDYIESRLDDINYHNNNLKEGEKKITFANLDYKEIVNSIEIDKEANDSFSVYILKKYSESVISTKTGKINEGSSRINKYLNTVVQSDGISFNNDATIVRYTNPYLVGSITAASFLLLGLIGIAIFSRKYGENFYKPIHDNETIYRTPFHVLYWKNATDVFNKVKNIAFIAILFSMMLVSKFIKIPAGFGPLSIGFGYLFFATIGMLYGPIAGLAIGMMSDVLGYFLVPSGYPFFPGYTFDAMLAGFTYGIFFYKTKLTFAKCLYARLIVNIFVNILLGSIWWSIINDLTMEATLTYMVFVSLPKNLIYLLPQALFIYILFKALGKPLYAMGLLDERIADNISIF